MYYANFSDTEGIHDPNVHKFAKHFLESRVSS